MRKIIALLVALAAAGALTLTASAPAQAAGWSPQRCDNHPHDGAKICVQVHTVPSGGGVRTDQITVCAYKVEVPGPQFFQNGTKANSLAMSGASGAFIAWTPLAATGASYGGSCSNTDVSIQSGAGACWGASGTIDLSGYPDTTWVVSGNVLSGAC